MNKIKNTNPSNGVGFSHDQAFVKKQKAMTKLYKAKEDQLKWWGWKWTITNQSSNCLVKIKMDTKLSFFPQNMWSKIALKPCTIKKTSLSHFRSQLLKKKSNFD